jgi:hypothetical protein
MPKLLYGCCIWILPSKFFSCKQAMDGMSLALFVSMHDVRKDVRHGRHELGASTPHISTNTRLNKPCMRYLPTHMGQVPPLAPRQLAIMARASIAGVSNAGGYDDASAWEVAISKTHAGRCRQRGCNESQF